MTLCICPSPENCTTRKVNPHVNHRLSLITMYQYWFINSKKCTTPIQDVKKGNLSIYRICVHSD